jgi:hypothetical protein
MSKARSTGNISNVIKTSTTCVTVTDGTTDLLIMSGSGRVTIPGDLVVLGGIAGSSVESSSYALNADKIDNLDSSQLVLTSSFNSYISSASSSLGSLSGSVATTTSGLSGRITTVEGNYTTTGSNIFVGDQVMTGSICSTGNIVTTGQIVAQTINVQQVTSSIVYSCGSNIFGNSLTNTQQFTGSVSVTGSLTTTGPMVGSSIFCSPVGNFSNCLTFADWTTAENVLTSNKPNEQGAYIRAAVSNALTPTYAFENDRDTGVYRDGANSLGFATSGSARMTISSTGDSLFNGTIVVQGACSSRICLIKDYSGTPSNTGFLITDTNGIITFNHNANGAGTTIGGVTCIGSNLCVAGNGYFAGNVGIGCTSPTFHLEVRCAASTSSCYLAAMFSRSTGANDGVGDIVAFGANGVSAIAGIFRTVGSWGLELQTAGRNTRMRIDNSGITTFCCQVCAPVGIFTGCVGIGSTNPGAPLELYRDGGNADTTGGGIIFSRYQASGDYRGSGIFHRYISAGGSNDSMVFTVSEGGNPYISGTTALDGRVKMVLTQAGRLGIGTTSPAARLTVSGTQVEAHINNGDTNTLALGNFSGGQHFIKSINLGVALTPLTLQASSFTFDTGNVGIGCVSPGVSLTIGGTDAIKVPAGTTPQRPTPTTGMVRFNSSCTEMEYYNGSEWLFFTSTPTTQGYYADVLVVGGGGGGGGAEASNGFGGGGAGGGSGGFMAGRIFINYALQSYSIFIGGGGTGGSNESQGTGSGCNGTMGTASCALGLVAVGGGFGGGDETGTGGGNGGSGGGTGGDNSGPAGVGLLGQGCSGGANGQRNGGGGGGASTTGFQGYFANNNGGNGRTWLNGTTYAGGGGGGGGAATTFQPLGGSGGGGNGSSTNGTSASFADGGTAAAGTTNTGGGGGGGAAGRAQGGQNGGSGIVVIRYQGSQKGFGGSITSSGGYTYHTFTTSGTYCSTYY